MGDWKQTANVGLNIATLGDGLALTFGALVATVSSGLTFDMSGNIVVKNGSGIAIDGTGHVTVNAGVGLTVSGGFLVVDAGTGLSTTGGQVFIPGGAITTALLAALSVGTAQIQNAAVTSTQIAAATITTANIGAAQITTALITRTQPSPTRCLRHGCGGHGQHPERSDHDGAGGECGYRQRADRERNYRRGQHRCGHDYGCEYRFVECFQNYSGDDHCFSEHDFALADEYYRQRCCNILRGSSDGE